MNRLILFILTLTILMACSEKLPEEVNSEYEELQEEISYSFDVKPILSDKCYHCHGPDAEVRKAGLRLDTQEGLFSPGLSGLKAFVPGSFQRSEALKRIISNDPEYMMPPVDSHRELSAKEVAILTKWVDQGAPWEKHWSFIPPKKKVPPKSPWKTANEIDQFVHRKLVAEGVEPASQADRARLLRRVTMDLTGLPPSISEQEDFLSDQSEDAYEKVIDRLLHSDAYAERMTLEWLDVARYADSHGFHADGVRRSWPWRDWVIQSFKQNKPYDDFITEQLAGDLLDDPSQEQIIATAFNRNHPMTAEGGVVDEEFRLEYVANRTNTLGTALMGLTLECSRCHDHKFDPISQKQYYSLSAFFNNVREVGMTGDDGDFGPMVLLTDEETRAEKEFLERKIDSLAQLAASLPENGERSVRPVFHGRFEKIENQGKDRKVDGKSNFVVEGEVELLEGKNGKAASFDSQYDRIYIDEIGAFDAYQSFTVSAWVMVRTETGKTKVIIGNAGEKNNLWRGWDLYLDSTNHLSFRLISSIPHNMIHVKTDESITAGTWNHVYATYDGSMSAKGIELAINGNPKQVNVVYDRLYKNILPTNTARTLDDRGLKIGQSYRAYTGDNGILDGLVDEVVIFDEFIPAKHSERLISQIANNSAVELLVPQQSKAKEIQRQLRDHRKKYLKTLDSIPELMVMEEMQQTRPTFILNRGLYDQPGEQVAAGVIDELLRFDEKWPTNRLGLANWLFDPDHPLTARVAVNRYWQMIFGKGLVVTANDFGNQGSLPSHPDLLDWLAVDFMESGWDVKALIKKMVMSATYMQESTFSPDLMERDPENILLARGPSYRWPAEFIRDNALAASGLLNDELGGESVKPYQPEGLWIELGNFSYFLLNYKQDRDERQYRRSMYTFIRRTSPPPFMTLFDAPTREVCTITRERTNTPLQALVLMNDPQFVEASRSLASRVNDSDKNTLEDQISMAFRLALSRTPKPSELTILIDLYNEQVNYFRSNIKEIEAFLEVGDFEVAEYQKSVEMAALTMVSNTILNMDEAYTKR